MRKHVPTDQSGFTLMEILIVVILLGILAMVVVPQITNSSEDTKVSTLQSNLGQLRSLLEIYYAQHNETYPGEVDVDGSSTPDATDAAVAFVKQLIWYTDADGKASSSKDKTNYPLGPYIKGATLPSNPFNNSSTILIDTDTKDLLIRAVDGTGTFGYKFYVETGVLIACDSEDHMNF
jgi:prepilin-type N-terminal cleavage/methylation domain-containing protein